MDHFAATVKCVVKGRDNTPDRLHSDLVVCVNEAHNVFNPWVGVFVPGFGRCGHASVTRLQGFGCLTRTRSIWLTNLGQERMGRWRNAVRVRSISRP